MAHCLFCSDLHGRIHRYGQLFQVIRDEEPDAVFLGGDLLPGAVQLFSANIPYDDFVNDFGEYADKFELETAAKFLK